MKNEEHGFVFMPSYYKAIRRLEDADRLKLYDAITDYAFEERVPNLPENLTGYFDLIYPHVKSSIEKYAKAKRGGDTPKKPRK